MDVGAAADEILIAGDKVLLLWFAANDRMR